jgi:hypothetical protein
MQKAPPPGSAKTVSTRVQRYCPRTKRQYVLTALSVLCISLGLAEVLLRLVGFGKGAIYVSSPDYEYIHAPNQHTQPFHNLLITNEFGMRSEPLRPGDRVLAFVVGDSVINGGNHTDHFALATTLLDQAIRRRYGDRWRVLTVSSGSWGPDNVAAFLRRHGTFGAQQILVVFSSHDLGDIMTHEPIVGTNLVMPDHYPLCVLCNTIARYAIPILASKLRATKDGAPRIDKYDGRVNPGWQQLLDIGKQTDARVTVLLHLEKAEHLAGHPNTLGDQLREYLHSLRVEVHEETHLDAAGYYDSIHPNAKGQRQLFEDLIPLVQPPR